MGHKTRQTYPTIFVGYSKSLIAQGSTLAHPKIAVTPKTFLKKNKTCGRLSTSICSSPSFPNSQSLTYLNCLSIKTFLGALPPDPHWGTRRVPQTPPQGSRMGGMKRFALLGGEGIAYPGCVTLNEMAQFICRLCQVMDWCVRKGTYDCDRLFYHCICLRQLC